MEVYSLRGERGRRAEAAKRKATAMPPKKCASAAAAAGAKRACTGPGQRAQQRAAHWARALDHMARFPRHNGNAVRELGPNGLPVLHSTYATCRKSVGGKAPRKELASAVERRAVE
jgi:hypothetical protein